MSGTVNLAPIPAYFQISTNEQQRVTTFEKNDPQAKANIAYFTRQAPKLTSVNALLKDYRSLGIVLGAFGMSDTINQTGLLKKLMTEDPTSSTSVAQRLGNASYLRFAKAMGQFQTSPFATAANVAAITNAVGTNDYEAAQDKLSPGIADALYFKRMIGSVTTLTQLMADPKLLQVAATATNMPAQFGEMDYTQQVSLLSAQINMKDFQKTGAVDKFVTKYLAINEANNASVNDPSGALATLTGSGSAYNVLGSAFPQASSSSGTSILSLFA